MSVDLYAPDEVFDLIKAVRNDKDSTTWVTLAYKGDNELTVHGSGSGGLDEFRGDFDPKERMYGLCRLNDVYDGHVTVKFVFICWSGASVGVIKKAKMATHKGSIENIIGQAHIAIDASEADDLSNEVVMGRITDASGSGSRVLNVGEKPRGHADVSNVSSAPKGAPSVPKGGANNLDFPDKESIDAANRRVRNDNDAADWWLMGYDGDSNKIVLNGVGEGGIEELKSHLSSSSVNYGIVRVVDVYDGHKTVKFVLIIWIGESVKIMRKATIATHKGAVLEVIGQYHVDVTATSLNELSHDIIMAKVTDFSGSGSRVLEKGAAPRGAPVAKHVVPVSGKAPSVPKSSGSGNLEFADEAEIDAAIKRVRDDNDSADWVLIGYEGQSNTVVLTGLGAGGIEELKQSLSPDSVNYGIVRVVNFFDGHKTIKFVLIIWIGESVKIMRKAKIATHKGEILKVMGQYHTDITASNLSELSQDEIMRKVGEAAGTASHII